MEPVSLKDARSSGWSTLEAPCVRAYWIKQPTNSARNLLYPMFQVAVYGKGGIGKSTISANVSVALAEGGAKVMQVGCDPKHDSTRLLLGGRSQQTVLDYVRDVPVGKRRLEDLIFTGTSGVLCTEAGGPEPGIGCAGRGILTTFDTLGKLGADDLDVDVRIYDVLGDVVCGGFAVPLRNEYADAVILVTSGEFMAMYAANNIMRGLANFDSGRHRLLGIVLNSRGVEGESESVRRFAEAAGTTVIAEIPRDALFADAEARGHTVMELHPDSAAAGRMREIAARIRDASRDPSLMTTPVPLDDDQMTDLAAGRPIRPRQGDAVKRIRCGGCRRTIRGTRVMSSCAAYGAVGALTRMEDVAVVIHGPMSCAHLMETTRAKANIELYAQRIYRAPPVSNIRCTRMDDSAAVFGGNRFLEECLRETAAEGFRKIAVVTTCMPGIIGDDCRAVTDRFEWENPGVRVMLVQTDGDVAGEYNDGFLMAAREAVGLIDTSVEPEDGLVNLVATSFFDLQSHQHLAEMDGMLSAFGLRVNCKLLDQGSPAPPEEFCRARTDILLNDTRNTRELMAMVTERTGREPFPEPMPLGLRGYEAWAREMGRLTGRSGQAEAEISRARAEYAAMVEEHRPMMEGLRVLLVWKMGLNPDWLIDVLRDLGVEILRIGFAPNPRKAEGAPDSSYEVTENYTDDDFRRDLEEMRPDVLISDLLKPVPEGTAFARLSRMGVGYRPVFEYVRYLEDTLRLPAEEGWRTVP